MSTPGRSSATGRSTSDDRVSKLQSPLEWLESNQRAQKHLFGEVLSQDAFETLRRELTGVCVFDKVKKFQHLYKLIEGTDISDEEARDRVKWLLNQIKSMQQGGAARRNVAVGQRAVVQGTKAKHQAVARLAPGTDARKRHEQKGGAPKPAGWHRVDSGRARTVSPGAMTGRGQATAASGPRGTVAHAAVGFAAAAQRVPTDLPPAPVVPDELGCSFWDCILS